MEAYVSTLGPTAGRSAARRRRINGLADWNRILRDLTKLRFILADILVEIDQLRQEAGVLPQSQRSSVEREIDVLQSSAHRILSVVDVVEDEGPPS